jgi:PAS domain S-box-containing protein
MENPNPVLRLGSDGRILFANPASAALLQHWGCLADEMAPAALREVAAAALESAEQRTFETELGQQVIAFSVVPVTSMGYVNLYGADVTHWKRAEKARHESEERYRLLFENSPDGILLTMPDGTVLAANAAACRMFGRTEEDICRIGRDGLVDNADPRLHAALAERIRTGKYHAEYYSLRSDGTRFPSEVTSVVFKGTDGQLRASVIVHDISERKKKEAELHQLNRTLRAHSHSDQALVRASTEAEYLDEVCRIVVQECGYAMVWIGFAEDDDDKTVRPAAYAGFDREYLDSLHITWADTERGRGPTGTAIRTGRPGIVHNMLTDPNFAPWREEALQRGYRSSLVLPLMADDKALGTLNIYSNEPDSFSDQEVALLASLAGDLSYGIRMIRLRTSHALAMEALRESEQRYRTLFNEMTEGFAVHEIICNDKDEPIDYRFLEVNPAFESLTGLKREHVIGRTVLDVLPGEDPRWIEIYGSVALTGKPVHFENYSPVLRKYYDVYAYSPAPRQFAALFMDVSARRQMEEDLRVNLAKYSVLFDSFPLGITVTNQDGKIVETNQEAERLLGIPQAEHLGRAIDGAQWHIIRTDGTPMPSAEYASVRALKEQQRVENVEMGIVHDDGKVVWISVTAAPLDVKGYGVVIAYNDITIRKQAERELERMFAIEAEARREAERANELKLKFLAMISHELRTPLTSIKGFASTLLAEDVSWDVASQHDFIETIDVEADKLTEMIEQLLDLSRIEAGTLRISPSECSLDEIFSLAMLQLQSLTEDHHLVVDLPSGLPKVRADAQRIGQVLANLVDNATKYAPPQTTVCITARQADGWLEICVSDEGPGISDEDRERLFQAFRRGDGAQRRTRGTGLGLAICKGLVEAHGGRIWLRADAGSGTTMCFTLPILH